MFQRVVPAVALGFLWCLMPQVHADNANSVGPAGTWKWSYDYGEGEITSLLTLHQKDDAVTGVYHDTDKEIEVQEGSFDGERVKFQFDVVRDGQTIKVKFSGKPEDDAITGTLTAVVDGEEIDFPWKARRATRPDDVVGLWKLTVKADNGQTYEPEVKLTSSNSELSGEYLTTEIGDHDVETVTLSDNVLKFSLSISLDGRKLKLNYSGRPRGDRMAGKVSYEFDGASGAVEFSGVHTPPKDE